MRSQPISGASAVSPAPLWAPLPFWREKSIDALLSRPLLLPRWLLFLFSFLFPLFHQPLHQPPLSLSAFDSIPHPLFNCHLQNIVENSCQMAFAEL